MYFLPKLPHLPDGHFGKKLQYCQLKMIQTRELPSKYLRRQALLVKQSTIYGELKPEIKFIEMMQTEGGFIAGRFEIVFKVSIEIVKMFFISLSFYS